jgi:hypothetical protein
METGEFLEDLFGEETGYVYAPIKGRLFEPHFFKWPEKKEKLLTHILTKSQDAEVYIGPMLFKAAKVHPLTFKGTHYIWTEFDGNAPRTFDVEPTIRIQSSLEGYEHWYWRLDKFTADVDEITDITKRLAYQLEADLSVWDYATVLRPPGTFNHKRKAPVTVLRELDSAYPLDSFEFLPKLPDQVNVKVNSTTLPKVEHLIARYTWNDDAFDLLTKEAHELGAPNETGDRSGALYRLGMYCAEMGMSNDEIFVILKHVDARWKKYHGRTDADKRLVGLVSSIRTKKAAQYEVSESSGIYRLKDFLKTKIKLKWIIPGLLPVAGSGLIFGPSAVGKSTFTLRMLIAIATGAERFLDWEIEREQKVLFISLEMPHDELDLFIQDMNLSEAELEKLQENFFIWPIGHAYPFDTKDQQIELLKYVDQFGIELVTIDSLGVSTYGSISNQDDMKRLFSFLNEDLRKARGCGYFLIHHPRKPGVSDVRKPQDFYDAYGDTYIINNAQTVINLNPVSGTRKRVNVFKSRLSVDQRSFDIKQLSDRSFEVVETKVTKKEPVEADSPGIFKLGARKSDS